MGSCAECRGADRDSRASGAGSGYGRLLLVAAAWLLQLACIGAGAAPDPAPDPAPGLSAEAGLAASGLAMEVEADPPAPYLQSRVRYRVRILARVPLRQATLSEPTAEQAIIRRIGDDRRFDLERDGVRYRVLERLYAIVPQRPGPLRIIAPRLSAAVPVTSMPGAEQAQAGLAAVMERLETVTRTGPTLLLEVRPIPAAAELPWLAAESVSISERWEPSAAQVRVGETITRSITIEASGLIGASVPELPVVSVEGFRAYPQMAEISEQVSGDDLTVTANIRRSYVPTVPGELLLPAVRVPWWSVGMDAPRGASLPARQLRVDEAASQAGMDGDQRARASFARDAAADLWGQQWPALLFALAWLTTLLLWRRERGRRRAADPRRSAAAGETTARGTDAQVLRFKRACLAGDARAARAALLEWGRSRWPHRAPRGPLDLLEMLDADPAAMHAALGIEQDLYGPEASAGWDGKRAQGAIVPLLEAALERASVEQPSLPSLYPANNDHGSVSPRDIQRLSYRKSEGVRSERAPEEPS